MATGIRKTPIGALAPDINNSLIIGVIIAKQNYRVFPSKKDSEERAVWNFTLRDSPTDTINASFWGSADGMKMCCEMYTVGDTVEIRNPRIMFYQSGSLNTNFIPTVSSPFQLQLQENVSEMMPYAEEDAESIRVLRHVPTKAAGDFLRLSDVQCYGQAMRGEHVNLLVAVRNGFLGDSSKSAFQEFSAAIVKAVSFQVGDTRSVKAKKDNRNLTCRDIVVMDQSLVEFHITLWNEDTIQQAEGWRPRQTILFLADMKMEWSSFKKAITASMTSCTIITENPRTTEAADLRSYARTVPIQATAMLDHLASSIIDPNTITTVMTTAQVLDKAHGRQSGNQFTAMLYAMVTHLDLDGPRSATTFKCSRCSQYLPDAAANCLNLECPIGSGAETAPPDVIFNLRVNLTDHRGTLQGCRLVSPTAEKILGCSVDMYLNMTLEQKTQLKWRFLLTRCEARVLVLCASVDHLTPLVSVVGCIPADPNHVSSKLPIY